MGILDILIAVLVGIGIGVLSGMLGIGGGVVMVPVFKLGFGMAAIGATATSLFAIIPTAVAGSITHLRQRTCIPKLGVLAGVGGACLSPVGVLLAGISPGWLVMLAAAVVIGYSAITMLRKALAAPKAKAVEQGALQDEQLARSEWWGLPIGAVAGLVAGYVGVGGGFLMVPLFLTVMGVSMKRASGTSLLAISILSLPGALLQLALGNVAVGIALAVVAGSVPGAALGAHLLKRIPERQLRFAFGVLLLVAAVSLVLQEVGVF